MLCFLSHLKAPPVKCLSRRRLLSPSDLYTEAVSCNPPWLHKASVFDASDAVWWNQRAQPFWIFGVMKSWMEAAWDQGVVFDMNSVSAVGEEEGGGGRRGGMLSSSCQTCFSTLINHLKRSLRRSACLETQMIAYTYSNIWREMKR